MLAKLWVMKASAVVGLLAFLVSCQGTKIPDSSKPYTVAMTYVADCPLSVKSSGAWLSVSHSLPADSFERWLFVGECDRPLSKALQQSADRVLVNMDSALQLGFTHYPMVQIWKGSVFDGELLYRGPLNNGAISTGQTRIQADSNYVQAFLTRLRTGENPTFEEHAVYGCYIEVP